MPGRPLWKAFRIVIAEPHLHDPEQLLISMAKGGLPALASHEKRSSWAGSSYTLVMHRF